MAETRANVEFRSTAGDRVPVESPTLVVAGYTGRDRAAVQRHVDELAAIGVPPPTNIPEFYLLDADLLTGEDRVSVHGINTSGEVEPVLVRSRGRYYLGIGSDHTDRDIERASVNESKAACAKPIGAEVLALPGTPEEWPWDEIEIRASVDGRDYQRGALATIRRPADLLGRLADVMGEIDDDLVLFCGTVPLLEGEFIAGTAWELRLELPNGVTLSHTYKALQGEYDAVRN